MARFWDRIAEDNAVYLAGDFASAMYQLITEQALYYHNRDQRNAYNIVKTAIPHFKEAASICGCELHVSDDYAFVAAIPKGVRRNPISRADTLLALVLRKLYQERMTAAELLDTGSAIVTIEELQDTYRSLTGLELPVSTTELRDTIRRMKRYGLAKEQKAEEDDIQPFNIEMLPGIVVLLSDVAMQRLAAQYAVADIDTNEDSGESTDETA